MKRFAIAAALLAGISPALAESKNAEWLRLILQTAKAGGRFATVCQPEAGTCNKTLTSSDGNYIAKETFDKNDKLILRQICKIGYDGMRQDCIDFDTSARWVQMWDSQTNRWLVVK